MTALVRATGLKKSFAEGTRQREVLSGVDLEIASGEFVAIFGPSGSGKSTLLNLLGLLDVPTEGNLELDGVEAAKLGENERARLRREDLGFVFQFDALLPEFSLLENVAMPLRIRRESPRAALAAAEKAIARFGLERVKNNLPQTLSGGEKQRAQIARAIVGAPKALLADEPTGNLDRENADIVFEGLKGLAQEDGLGIVLVTHDQTARGFVNRSLQLSDGKLAESLVK